MSQFTSIFAIVELFWEESIKFFYRFIDKPFSSVAQLELVVDSVVKRNLTNELEVTSDVVELQESNEIDYPEDSEALKDSVLVPQTETTSKY